jgi:hypothetical protein
VTLCLLHWVDSINLLAVSASCECSISDYKRHNVNLSPLKKSGPTTCERFQVSSFLSGETYTVQQIGGRAYLNAPPKTNLLTLKSQPVACQGASLEHLHAAPGTHSDQWNCVTAPAAVACPSSVSCCPQSAGAGDATGWPGTSSTVRTRHLTLTQRPVWVGTRIWN